MLIESQKCIDKCFATTYTCFNINKKGETHGYIKCFY